MTRQRRARGGPLLGGLGLIVLGVLLALAQLELVDVAALLTAGWPLILLVRGGGWLLVGPRWTGAILVTVGALALAGIHLALPVAPTRLIVPTILLGLGLALIAGGVRSRRPAATGAGRAASGSLRTEPGATALLGDVHLHLPGDADPHRGAVVRAPVTSVLGDVHVSVPAGCVVHDRTTRLLGDVTLPDDAADAAADASPAAGEGATVVELHGTVLLGDVTVTRRAADGAGPSWDPEAAREEDR